jgi:histidinol-phosphate aminotransferase
VLRKLRPHLRDLHRSRIGEKARGGFLCLDMNEGIPGLPEAFVRRTLASIDSGFLCRYPEYHRLKQSLARRNGLGSENISLSNGSDGSIKNIFDAFIGKGDRVLMTDPTFAMYPVYCRMYEAEAEAVEYGADLAFPYDEFSARLRRGVKLAVVVNPNNPTGSILEPGRLLRLIQRARKADALFLVDEAYFYYHRETVMPWVRRYENLIVLRTFSKLCGLAAARIGYAAASAPVVECLRKVKSAFDVSALGVVLAQRILEEPGLMRRLMRSVAAGKAHLVRSLRRAGIPHVAGRANFVLIHCGEVVPEVVHRLAERRVLVSGGFRQESLQPYIRVTVGDRPTMERFLKAFLPVWRELDR